MTQPLRRAVLDRRRAKDAAGHDAARDGADRDGSPSHASPFGDVGRGEVEQRDFNALTGGVSPADDVAPGEPDSAAVAPACLPGWVAGSLTEALDDDQREAVSATGDVVLEAAVGSGKTTVLIERVRALRRSGIPLARIAVLTFTRKAATEVLWRLGAAPGSAGRAGPTLAAGDDTWLVGTFHSVARGLLSRALPVETLGFSRRFRVLDAHRRAALWRDLIARHGLDIRYVDALEARVAGVAEGRLRHGQMRRDDDLLRLVELYEVEKRALDLMDFDDLLHGATALLSALPPERRPLHVIVDELQDCDSDQLDLLAALRGGEGPSLAADGGAVAGPAPLFAVGDPHQAIYGWRCVDADAFAACRERFGCRTLRLRANRRSQATLVAAADALRRGALALQTGQAPWAPLQAVRPAGARIDIVRHGNAATEAAWVAEALAAALAEGVAPARLAVLARLRRQLLPVAQACLRLNLPLRRPPPPGNEAAALAWLQALLRAGLDGELGALRLSLGDAERGLCPAAILRAVEPSTGAEFDALGAAEARLAAYGRRSRRFDSALAQRTFEGLRALGPLLTEGAAAGGGDAMARRIAAALPIHGLLRPTRADFADEASLVDHALRAICADAIARGGRDLRDALRDAVEDASLAGHLRPLEDAGATLVEELAIDREGIALRTIHAAKGLEFDRVWLVGCNEGVLPIAGAWSRPEALREEQRLLFVAVTRARDRLEIGWSAAPDVPRASGEPSALLRMLPAECVDWHVEARLTPAAEATATAAAAPPTQPIPPSAERAAGGHVGARPARPRPAVAEPIPGSALSASTSSAAPASPPTLPQPTEVMAALATEAAGADPLCAGATVRHGRHGEGTVVASDALAIEVDFVRFGRKRLLRSLAGLVPVAAPASVGIGAGAPPSAPDVNAEVRGGVR